MQSDTLSNRQWQTIAQCRQDIINANNAEGLLESRLASVELSYDVVWNWFFRLNPNSKNNISRSEAKLLHLLDNALRSSQTKEAEPATPESCFVARHRDGGKKRTREEQDDAVEGNNTKRRRHEKVRVNAVQKGKGVLAEKGSTHCALCGDSAGEALRCVDCRRLLHETCGGPRPDHTEASRRCQTCRQEHRAVRRATKEMNKKRKDGSQGPKLGLLQSLDNPDASSEGSSSGPASSSSRSSVASTIATHSEASTDSRDEEEDDASSLDGFIVDDDEEISEEDEEE